VEDQFDWHNTFVGGYFMGDISFVRYTSVNNDHAVYWKYGKNMADPEECLSFSFSSFLLLQNTAATYTDRQPNKTCLKWYLKKLVLYALTLLFIKVDPRSPFYFRTCSGKIKFNIHKFLIRRRKDNVYMDMNVLNVWMNRENMFLKGG